MRIFCFLVVATVAFTALHCLIVDDHLRIALFGLAMLTLAIAFPHVSDHLHGETVDLIYYSVGIAAAVLLFVSRESEQRVGRLSGQIALLTENQRSLADRSSALRAATVSGRKELEEVRASIDATRKRIAAPELKELTASEREVSEAILASPPFARHADHLRSRQKLCSQIVPALRTENSYLFAQINRLRVYPAEREPWKEMQRSLEHSRDLVDQARFEANTRHIDECAKVDKTLEQLQRSSPSFDKVLALKGDMLQSALETKFDPSSLDTLIAVSTRNEKISVIIERIAEAVAQPLSLRSLERTAGQLEADIPRHAMRARRAKTMAHALRSKSTGLKTAVHRIRDEPARGLVLWSGRMLMFYWPYMLIAFLALKIARKKYPA